VNVRVKVKDSAAVVVGGASGMGRATAERLAERGARVAVLDLPTSAGAVVADELGAGASFHPCNVTDSDGVETALAAAVEDLGAPAHRGEHRRRWCIGAHAVQDRAPLPGRLPVRSRAQSDRHLQSEPVAGLAHESQRADDAERGVVVNTSSIAAFEGQIGQVAYTAAKAGIAGMTLTMARDLGSLGIRVTAIAPSLFATGSTSRIPEEMAGELTRDAAFPRRMGRPDEYAALALAIVENQMLNGSAIRLDAGQRFAPK
jgi:NAD(P)-dependent dehydrogenase (short-subunit alcohol dehydrogenase family)